MPRSLRKSISTCGTQCSLSVYSTIVRSTAGLAVLLAMFIYVASTSEQLGSWTPNSSIYQYGRGFAVVVASFVSANVAAVSATYVSGRQALTSSRHWNTGTPEPSL